MKYEQRLLISFASEFVSFLLRKIENLENIRAIYLFGSVVRGDIKPESDVDIFIDLFNEDKNLDKIVPILIDDFYSSKIYELWKNLGVKNKINVIYGRLDEWPLKDSIFSEGIVLFSRAIPEKLKIAYLIYWDKIEDKKKRVTLFRKLFGYKYKGKKYRGLSDKISLEKIGKNSIIVSKDNADIIVNILVNLGIKFKIKKILLPL